MRIIVNETPIFTLQFADDQVIIAKNKKDREEMTIKIREKYKKWGTGYEGKQEKIQTLII